jgi:hypothetical protein
MEVSQGQQSRNERRRAITLVAGPPCEPAAGGFTQTAPTLLRLGYSPIPIRLGTKRPAISNWSRACEAPLSAEEIAVLAERFPDAGVAVATGYGGLVAVDVDTDDPDIVRALLKVLGEAAVSRRALKGFASFYRVKGDTVPSRQFKGVLDVLGCGRNCIVPPSKHPSGVEYRWITPATLLNTPLHALPIVGEM